MSSRGSAYTDPFEELRVPESTGREQLAVSNGGYDNLGFCLDYNLPDLTVSRNANGDGRERWKQQKATRRRSVYLAVILTFVILTILVITIALAVSLTKKHDVTVFLQSTETPLGSKDPDFEGSFRLLTSVWDPDMANVSSDVFKNTATKYETMIEDIFKASNVSSIIQNAVVTELREGSVVVYFNLHLKPVSDMEDSAPKALHWAVMSRPGLLIAAFRDGVSNLLASPKDVQYLSDISLSSIQIHSFATTTTITTTATTISTPAPSNDTVMMTVTSSAIPQTTDETSTETTSKPSPQCGEIRWKPRARIVGGAAAGPGIYPWVVMLRVNDKFACGGSIIDPLHVISAAHCFDNIIYPGIVDGWEVIAGEVKRDPDSWSEHVQRVTVTRVYSHPDFNEVTQADQDSNLNDIAVLRLSNPLSLNNYVSTICLPRANDSLPERCTVAGWGSVKMVPVMLAEELQVVTLWTYNSTACRDVFDEPFSHSSPGSNISNFLTDGVMCAANGLSGGQDACIGDSGGPLFCPQQDEEGGDLHYIQFGVVSWGEGCAVEGNPGFYTYLPYFISWIQQVAVPALGFAVTVDGLQCLNETHCVESLQNIKPMSSVDDRCRVFTSTIDCVLGQPLTDTCSRQVAETEVLKYVQYLNVISLASSPFDFTACTGNHNTG